MSISASLPILGTHVNILFRQGLSRGCATCSQGDHWKVALVSETHVTSCKTEAVAVYPDCLTGMSGLKVSVAREHSVSYEACWVLCSAFSTQPQDWKTTMSKSGALMYYLTLTGPVVFRIHNVSDYRKAIHMVIPSVSSRQCPSHTNQARCLCSKLCKNSH